MAVSCLVEVPPEEDTCGFRFMPATYSEMMSATVPI